MMNMNIKKISEALDGVRTVAIAGHVRPDGDCVGSCMGMKLYLEEYYPQLEAVDVYLESVPDCYDILPKTEEVRTDCSEERTYDLFLSMDCADRKRLGGAQKYFESASHTICFDHHISNPGYAEENYIFPDSSSTSEVIFHAMDKEKISRPVAEALYMGVINDTGVFQYSCTSPETLEMAAELLRKGIDGSYITETTFTEKTYLQNQILGRALLESMLVLDGSCIVTCVRRKDMDFFGVGPADLEGIVSQLRETKGVEVAIFLHELATHEYKISLRSKSKVDCSVIASYFGGGGHVRAAGCSMQGSFHDVVNNLTEHIEKQLQAVGQGQT